MTDKEIFKALECCVSYEYTCLNCPYCEEKHYTEENGFELMPNGKHYDDLSCDGWLKRDVFDLVNRQKAENEMLKGWEKLLKAESHAPIIKKAKAEAVKEFAEDVQGEIDDAIHSNYNAKEERVTKSKKLGIPIDDEDSFLMYCEGKIHALSGIRSYIDNLLKETVGDNE